MVSAFTNIWLSFIAGLFAPIAAVCVLPLYPGFLAYLAGQLSGKKGSQKKKIILLGLITTLGVIVSMALFGFIFTQLLRKSLTRAIGVISPIAFGILAIVSIFLIFNFDFSRLIPKFNAPIAKSPYTSSFGFGFFFGAIVLPCNPASLVVLFALSTSTVGFIMNFLNFIVFGIGMAAPLLIFALISSAKSEVVIGFLTKRQRIINLIAGLIMLGISLYYLIFVFRLLG